MLNLRRLRSLVCEFKKKLLLLLRLYSFFIFIGNSHVLSYIIYVIYIIYNYHFYLIYFSFIFQQLPRHLPRPRPRTIPQLQKWPKKRSKNPLRLLPPTFWKSWKSWRNCTTWEARSSYKCWRTGTLSGRNWTARERGWLIPWHYWKFGWMGEWMNGWMNEWVVGNV